MKWILLFLPTLAVEAADPALRMREAELAYKSNDFVQARAIYEDLIREGYVAPELFFNAGNTAFRLADYGKAVLNYRRAWYLAPRDDDVAANLTYTLSKAHLPAESLSLLERALSWLTLTEWSVVGLTAFWIASIASGLWLTWRQRASLWRGVTLSILPLVVLALAGVGFWLHWQHRNEWVVLKPGQKALFEPIDNAKAYYVLPPGSLVRCIHRSSEWLQIESGAEKGWVRISACEPVLPWKTDATL